MTAITVSDVIKAATDTTGAPAALVNTGGGCGAVEVTLERGAYLLLTDSELSLSADENLDAAWDGGVVVGFYEPSDDWDGSPSRMLECDSVAASAEVAELIARIMRGDDDTSLLR